MNATKGTTRRTATPVENGHETASPAVRWQTIQAIVQTECGSVDVLRLEEIDRQRSETTRYWFESTPPGSTGVLGASWWASHA